MIDSIDASVRLQAAILDLVRAIRGQDDLRYISAPTELPASFRRSSCAEVAESLDRLIEVAQKVTEGRV